MQVAAETGRYVEVLLARRAELQAQVREVEHWRRLVAARLDLAVAAVTDIDEPAGADLPAGMLAPGRLRRLVGIPAAVDALADASALLPLRRTLDELDGHVDGLRREDARLARALLDALQEAGAGDADTMAAVRHQPRRGGGRDTLPGRSGNPARRAVVPPQVSAEEAG